jgi:hypothetical protein
VARAFDTDPSAPPSACVELLAAWAARRGYVAFACRPVELAGRMCNLAVVGPAAGNVYSEQVNRSTGRHDYLGRVRRDLSVDAAAPEAFAAAPVEGGAGRGGETGGERSRGTKRGRDAAGGRRRAGRKAEAAVASAPAAAAAAAGEKGAGGLNKTGDAGGEEGGEEGGMTRGEALAETVTVDGEAYMQVRAQAHMLHRRARCTGVHAVRAQVHVPYRRERRYMRAARMGAHAGFRRRRAAPALTLTRLLVPHSTRFRHFLGLAFSFHSR